MVSKGENGLMQTYVQQWKLMKEWSLEYSDFTEVTLVFDTWDDDRSFETYSKMIF